MYINNKAVTVNAENKELIVGYRNLKRVRIIKLFKSNEYYLKQRIDLTTKYNFIAEKLKEEFINFKKGLPLDIDTLGIPLKRDVILLDFIDFLKSKTREDKLEKLWK